MKLQYKKSLKTTKVMTDTKMAKEQKDKQWST